MFSGQGRKTTVLTKKEEKKIKDHVIYKAKIGYGESWKTFRMLIQKLLIRIKRTNPDRMTGLEEKGQLPSVTWMRAFADRNGISLRKSSMISKGRAFISPKHIALWFSDIGQHLKSQPELREALCDPKRVFNQDETAIEHGVSDQFVLTMKGEKQTYSVSSSSREHTTISYTVNAAGGLVESRIVFPGKRNMAKTKLKLPGQCVINSFKNCNLNIWS